MPFSDYASLPDAVKTFLTKHSASDKEVRQWIHVFNSCHARGLGDERCFKQANGVLSTRFNEAIEDSINIDIGMREELVDGRKTWIIPAIFTREGVMSQGFKSWEELSKESTYKSLEGAPVTFHHPLRNAKAAPSFIIGKIIKVEPDAINKTLRGEFAVWQEDPRSQWLQAQLIAGKYRDGSVGFSFNPVDISGTYNGIPYIRKETDITFDHYAVGIERGACPQPFCGLLSNNDGECGCSTGAEVECECQGKKHGEKPVTAPVVEEHLYTGPDINISQGESNMPDSTSTDPAAGTANVETGDMIITAQEAMLLKLRVDELEKKLKNYEANEAARSESELKALRDFVKRLAINTKSFTDKEIDEMDRKALELAAKALSSKTDFSLKGSVGTPSQAFRRDMFGAVHTDPTVGDLFRKGVRKDG